MVQTPALGGPRREQSLRAERRSAGAWDHIVPTGNRIIQKADGLRDRREWSIDVLKGKLSSASAAGRGNPLR